MPNPIRTETPIPTPATIYAETEAQTVLDALNWIRAQGWMHGEFLTLVERLSFAYAQGYAEAVEFASETCPIADCACSCH